MYQAPTFNEYASSVYLRAVFDDERGTSEGTGFFLRTSSGLKICTARHVVDPRYRPRTDGYRDVAISTLHLHFWKRVSVNHQFTLRMSYSKIDKPAMFNDPQDGDCTLISMPTYVEAGDAFGGKIVEVDTLDVLTSEQAMDYAPGTPIVFSGFPQGGPVVEANFSGTDLNVPLQVLRQGVVATPLVMGFDVDNVLGRKCYGHIDSFALSGFSGSPVFTPEFGWRNQENTGIVFSGHRPRKLIGMICGHFRSSADRANGSHSGLSYMYRAINLRTLLQSF